MILNRYILLKKDEAVQNFMMEMNQYKCIDVQKLQSQVQDSVEKKETQGKAYHESREASAPSLLPLIPPLAQKLLQKKFSLYPYGDPLRTNLLMNVLQTSDVKVTASIQPVANLNLKIQVSLK